MSNLISYMKKPKANTQTILNMIPESDLSYKTSTNVTPLMLACQLALKDVALAMINTGRSIPGAVSTSNSTALMYLYGKKYNETMSDVALALINTGESKPEQVDSNGNTALMFACSNNSSDVALALINTGMSHPDQVDSNGKTALIFACENNMTDVALALINTGQSKPEQVDFKRKTALLYACQYKMTDVAIALINTGQSNPEYISIFDNNALIYSCYLGLSEVAIALIRLNVDIKHKNNSGKNALFFAKQQNLVSVIELLEKSDTQQRISFNINTTIFDIIEGIDKPLTDCINEGNVIFVFYDTLIENAIKVSIPYEQLLQSYQSKNDYIIYKCNKEDSMSSIDEHVPYFNIKKLTGFGDLVLLSDIDAIIINNMSRIFVFQKSSQNLLTTVTHNVLHNNERFVGDRHCQKGQSGAVYNLIQNIVYTCGATQTAGKRKQNNSIRRKHSKFKKYTKRRKCRKL